VWVEWVCWMGVWVGLVNHYVLRIFHPGWGSCVGWVCWVGKGDGWVGWVCGLNGFVGGCCGWVCGVGVSGFNG
jgi:hypothetical protein